MVFQDKSSKLVDTVKVISSVLKWLNTIIRLLFGQNLVLLSINFNCLKKMRTRTLETSDITSFTKFQINDCTVYYQAFMIEYHRIWCCQEWTTDLWITSQLDDLFFQSYLDLSDKKCLFRVTILFVKIGYIRLQ